MGLDFQVFRGGDNNAWSFTWVSVGDEGAEVEPLSAISSVTMIGRLTGDSLRLVNRPKADDLRGGSGLGEIRTVRSAIT